MFEKDSTSKQKYIGYVDYNYAGDLDKHQFTIRYVFILSRALVSWLSILQSIVTLSIAEIEYMAMTEAIKEAIWFQAF